LIRTIRFIITPSPKIFTTSTTPGIAIAIVIVIAIAIAKQ
jgi:hypothetical protein